jgi:hypothetical protein
MLKGAMEKVKPQVEEFKAKMKAEGYPEGIIDKSIERAYGYVQGVTKMLDSKNPELVERAQVEMFPEALEHSATWIRKLTEAISRS